MKSKLNQFLILIFSFAVFLFLSCNKQIAKKEKPKIQLVKAPQFNPDSAFDFIAKQASFGPRVPNTQSHQICGDYFIETLEEFAAQVTVQEFNPETYNGKILEARNIIAAFNPKLKKRILLAAHWDSRPYADQDTINVLQPINGIIDGAAGVGILLEIARVISSSKKPLVGVDIMLIDAEDYGVPVNYKDKRTENDYCLGSKYWATQKHHPTYHAYYGILLDHVGAANAKYTKEGYSVKYAPRILKKVWEIGQELGYSDYFINKKTETNSG